MNFNLEEIIELLERTPKTFEQLLLGLSETWLLCNEGEDTWNPIEVVDHLIEGEIHNWIPRLEHILKEGKTKPFPPFDRFSHLNKKNRSLELMLKEFQTLRTTNIAKLKELITTKEILETEGSHPDLGSVKVRELLSTWAMHDLTHLAQVSRTMAKLYSEDVGPWKGYLGILKD